MSIYRRQHRDKASGKTVRAALFTAEFRFHGRLHRQSGFPDRDSAKFWIASESLRLRRDGKGYVKPMLNAEVAPLIQEFTASLAAKGRDSMYVYTAEKRLTRLAGECGWKILSDVSRESLDKWLEADSEWRGKPIAPRTKNQYVDIVVEWGEWLASAKVRKLVSNPFEGAERLQARHNNEYRRAATIEELDKLLAVAGDRRSEYLFRIYQANIRRRTLRHMAFEWCHLDATPPFVLVPGEYDKGRKDKKYVLRYEIAQEIRKLKKVRKAKAGDLVFPDLATVEDLRADLTKAGVSFELEKNKGRIDFHALRSAIVQFGKQKGLTAFQMMDLMGWKSMQTMLKHYNRNSVDAAVGESMERLPAIGKVRIA